MSDAPDFEKATVGATALCVAQALWGQSAGAFWTFEAIQEQLRQTTGAACPEEKLRAALAIALVQGVIECDGQPIPGFRLAGMMAVQADVYARGVEELNASIERAVRDVLPGRGL